MRAAGKPRYILVAEVLRAHGLEGAVQARLLADSWEALGRPSTLYLYAGGPAGSEASAEGDPAPAQPLPVEWVRGAGQRVQIKLGGVNSREAAAALAGCRLVLPRGAAPPLPEDHYYHYDILGLAVVDAEGRDLGRVAEIVSTGANDVYVVRGPRGEWLLPALRRMITAVDTEGGFLRVENVADLLEAAASSSGQHPSTAPRKGGRGWRRRRVIAEG